MRMIVAAGLFALSSATLAAEINLPVYDIDGACHAEIIRQGVKPESADFRTVYNGCVEMDQAGYDFLKQIWPEIPVAIRDQCVGGSRSNKAFWLYAVSQCVTARMAALPDPRGPAHFQR